MDMVVIGRGGGGSAAGMMAVVICQMRLSAVVFVGFISTPSVNVIISSAVFKVAV